MQYFSQYIMILYVNSGTQRILSLSLFC